MSIEDLKEYGRRCQEEAELKAKVQAIGVGMDHFDAHVAHAKSLGLDISVADLEALSAEAGYNMELSDDALEDVAGGAKGDGDAAVWVVPIVVPGPIVVPDPPVVLIVGGGQEQK